MTARPYTPEALAARNYCDVAILLRDDPDASQLRRQSVRQAYSAPIKNMLPKEGAH